MRKFSESLFIQKSDNLGISQCMDGRNSGRTEYVHCWNAGQTWIGKIGSISFFDVTAA